MRLSLLHMARLIAFLFAVTQFTVLLGQEDFSLAGSLKVTNYSQKDYKANPQIFCIAQNEEGIMYFANQRGVLEYDGTNWKTIPLPDKAESLELLIADRFLIANTSGLGELMPNDKGEWEYMDLNGSIGDEVHRLFNVVKYKDYYVVSNFDKAIALDQDFQIVDIYLNPESNSGTLTVLDDGVYFRGEQGKLFRYNEEGFNVVWDYMNSEENQIIDVIGFRGSVIAATEQGKLFMIENNTVVKVFDDESITIKSIVSVDDQYISLGTYIDGIVILDKWFAPKYRITPEKGLNDGTILSQFVDAEKNLWLGTSNGISKVDLMSPIITYESIFNAATIEDLAFYKDNLIMATGGGAYELGVGFGLRKISGIADDCYGLKTIVIDNDTSLYISALYDVFKYDGLRTESITQGGPYNVIKSPLNDKQLVVLHYDGIQLLEERNGHYEELNYIFGFSEGEPFNFLIMENGDIWIGTKPNDGVYRINVQELLEEEASFKRYYTEEGLPIGQTYLFNYEGEIYCATNFGVYQLENDKFVVSHKFGVDFSKTGQGVHRISADPQGNVWMVLFKDDENSYEIGFSDKEEGYVWHSEFFSGYDEFIVHAIYHQNENVTWLGGPGGLMSFDKKRVVTHSSSFNALIREVNFGESVLFGGNGPLKDDYELPYVSKDKIEFKFASNTFSSEEKTQYSWMLVGFDDDWSEWSFMTFEDYALQEGTYTFKVRARNGKGEISNEASFTFTVLPPWYRTWWAYLLFFLILVLLIVVLIRLSIRRVKQQNIKLEKIVEERTQEVVAQKAEAEKQRDIAEHQKHLVEEKNNEILDSINYAERIQRSFLATKEVLDENLKDYFVFFRPKDVVSGDFYWGAELNDGKFAWSVADSTGHGVPGAIMSLLNISSLEKSIETETSPEKILGKTREIIINRLKKDGSADGGKDGMDCNLLVIDQERSTLTFASANNPVVVIRGGEILEFKGDKIPVGKHDRDQESFTLQTLQLQKGDVIYALTDGFPDQFGGEKGKKFMIKNLKNKFLEIAHLSMSEQEQLLGQEFDSWKEGHEQIDDVCIIGVRV
ncbi:MAG: SpoIIE family protein phosphatase [Flavobacteriales bacterium]|nr:SpoIIE family protein phosphatase [Flavobacteriales bacterium]